MRLVLISDQCQERKVNLTEAISANSAAKSRIMDVDFAKEQSNSVRLQILQQTATAALSQANMGPQAVLGSSDSKILALFFLGGANQTYLLRIKSLVKD